MSPTPRPWLSAALAVPLTLALTAAPPLAALAVPLTLALAAASPLAAPALAAQGDDAFAAGERYFKQAVKHLRARRFERAVEMFEKALPTRGETSDIFFNLVAAAEGAQLWGKVHLYAQGFLFLEPDTADARAIRRKMKRAAREAQRLKQAPAPVRFVVEPAGAPVHVGGVPVARGGGPPVALVPGAYEVTIAAPEYEPYRSRLEVAAGEPVEVSVTLVKMLYYGTLVVAPRPAEGVAVFLDDKPVGTTPLEPLKLQTNRYLVRFDKPGFDRWHRYVTIVRDQTVTLEPALERSIGGP
jgi:hypothetical protein